MVSNKGGYPGGHPNRDLQTQSKMYSCLRPTLSMLWGSFLRGLHAKVEPFKTS
jgi:hypothetical protein